MSKYYRYVIIKNNELKILKTKKMENLVNQSFPSLREERETGLEPAAPTLARSCSTN